MLTAVEDIDSETPESNSGIRPLLLLSVAFTSLVGSLLGYDIGVISGAIIYIEDDLHLSSFQAEIIVGSLNVVSAFGGLSSGYVADRLGRRPTVGIASGIFIVGTLIMCLSSSFGALLIGRIVMGLGIGCGFVIGPLYAAELSPARFRGMLSSLFEVAIGLGILLGYLGAYICRGLQDEWRWMIGLGIAPPLIILGCLFILPESPRFLWAQGKLEEAESVLNRVMMPDEVQVCIEDMQAGALESPRSNKQTKTQPNPWRELWKPTPVTRMLMIVGFGVSISQQANGSEAVVYYIPKILDSAGVEGDEAQLRFTIFIGTCRAIFIGVGCYCVDRLGRRPLLLWSTAGIAGALYTLSLGIGTGADAGITITSLCVFMASYAVGVGPVNMVLMAEIFPYHLRATAMSLGLFLNRLVSGLVASSFLSISDILTPAGAFFAFGVVATSSFVFVFKLVPETRGKSLEEMDAFFRSLVEASTMHDVIELNDFDIVDEEEASKLGFNKVSTQCPDSSGANHAQTSSVMM